MHSELGNPYGMFSSVMLPNNSPGWIYYREVFDKIGFEHFYAIEYSLKGVELHPISKAFTEAKKAGVEEVKNHIPYLWH